MRYRLAEHVRRYWRKQTLSGKVGTVLGTLIGVVLASAFWKEALDSPFVFLRAVLTFAGVFMKTLVVNAGALTEPLIAPLMHVSVFCWLVFSIALCFWVWGWCRRKLS